FKLLVDLNLTRTDYTVGIDGQNINPREVLLKVLDPIVELGEKEDAVLLRVKTAGEVRREPIVYVYEVRTYAERKKNITAMARATANTVTVDAQMIGNHTITKKGDYPPEQIIPGAIYIDEMAKRDVHIMETRREMKLPGNKKI